MAGKTIGAAVGRIIAKSAVIRAIRVFVYGAIPVVAAWVLDGSAANFEVGLRVTIAAALLSLIDKGARSVRDARAGKLVG